MKGGKKTLKPREPKSYSTATDLNQKDSVSTTCCFSDCTISTSPPKDREKTISPWLFLLPGLFAAKCLVHPGFQLGFQQEPPDLAKGCVSKTALHLSPKTQGLRPPHGSVEQLSTSHPASPKAERNSLCDLTRVLHVLGNNYTRKAGHEGHCAV